MPDRPIAEAYDVVIVGASFSGLTLAHHLPRHVKVLVMDAKPRIGSAVESTGLITERTRREFKTFFDIDAAITNPITSICVVAPGFDDSFVSRTAEPWIYQTDTRALMRRLAATLPQNVTLAPGTVYLGVDNPEAVTRAVVQSEGVRRDILTKVLVGADGARSKVAQTIPALDRHSKFLFGYEQVFFGNVRLGTEPERTISHFWFGEFSLGYGGWISPTVFDGRPAFRFGLAKLMRDKGDAAALLKKFLQVLIGRRMVSVEGDWTKPAYAFGNSIPIGGVLPRISHRNALLIGDAAGFCGAFAADGIKGSVVSGKEAAPLIEAFLAGDRGALDRLTEKMDRRDHLMDYYRRQIRYRWIWDLMKRDRTFRAMYDIIAAEREHFVDQFCDSKDTRKSLMRIVLKPRHALRLLKYAWYILLDRMGL